MKHINNEKGWIKPLLSIAVLGFCVYVGIQFGVPYYRYSAFKSDAREIARTTGAVGGDVIRKVKEEVYASAKDFKIPVQESDIAVEKRGERVMIRTSWSVDVDILGLYQRTLEFNVDIED